MWKVQLKLVGYIKNNFSNIKFVEDFLDGCVGLYKYFKIFLNFSRHQFGLYLAASWSLFTTSHRKSPCDGIGRVFKRKLFHVRETANPVLTN